MNDIKQPIFFAMNRNNNTACILDGPAFHYWEQVQGAFRCGIPMPDGQRATGIGHVADLEEFTKKAAHGKTTVLAATRAPLI